jgi:hypothetical protein
MQRLYNPKLGDYDVAVTVGPSFATKRAEAADSMLMFMKAVPQAGQLIADLIAKNMDWPGAEEISARLQSILPPGMADKKLDQLPPEAKGIVMQMQQQMAKLKQEHDMAVHMLGDKEADRNVDREATAKDFEAKVLKITADFETKMAAVHAKAGGQNDIETKLLKILADHEAKMYKTDLDHQAKLYGTDMSADSQRYAVDNKPVPEGQSKGKKGGGGGDTVQLPPITINTGKGSKIIDLRFDRDRDGKLVGMKGETKETD